jgi:hypothetical protein
VEDIIIIIIKAFELSESDAFSSRDRLSLFLRVISSSLEMETEQSPKIRNFSERMQLVCCECTTANCKDHKSYHPIILQMWKGEQ